MTASPGRLSDPVRAPLRRAASPQSRTDTPPDDPHHPSRRTLETGALSIASPLTRPSPFPRRVGIRIFTFEAFSGFTRQLRPAGLPTAQGGLCHEARPGHLKPLVSYRINPHSGWNSLGDTRRRTGSPGFSDPCSRAFWLTRDQHGRHSRPGLRESTGLRNPDFPVRPDGAYHQWRRVPPGELSIAPVADERFGRATDWAGAS